MTRTYPRPEPIPRGDTPPSGTLDRNTLRCVYGYYSGILWSTLQYLFVNIENGLDILDKNKDLLGKNQKEDIEYTQIDLIYFYRFDSVKIIINMQLKNFIKYK